MKDFRAMFLVRKIASMIFAKKKTSRETREIKWCEDCNSVYVFIEVGPGEVGG